MTKEEIEDEEVQEKYRSDWIEAQYKTMAWPKEIEMDTPKPGW